MKTKKKTLDERYDHLHTHTHKHLYTHIYIKVYISIYIYIHICGIVSSISIATDQWLGSPGTNPGANEIFALSDLSWVPPSLLYNGYWVFPGGKVRPGRAADHRPHLVPMSWKSSGILLTFLYVTQELNRFILPLTIIYMHIYL